MLSEKYFQQKMCFILLFLFYSLFYSAKTCSEIYSHIFLFAIISYCFKYLSRLSQINDKFRNEREKNMSVVYANETPQ